MKGSATRKITGGKMVRVDVEYDDTIKSVVISGDFFLYPEEFIGAIEQSLVGASVKETNIHFKNRIEDCIGRKRVQLVGFSTDDLAEVVKEALL